MARVEKYPQEIKVEECSKIFSYDNFTSKYNLGESFRSVNLIIFQTTILMDYKQEVEQGSPSFSLA
ncbi:hypothetical protein SAG0136_01915 [Streptococcus agalactiae LMG 14747]|uniref:Uncharacterized protein n=1 Tax=Streptococcus agalactiae LMG 14747 TaxID=1154860 RepID=V6YZV4_STRAG|nr:hypothetical protein SAG0136_01915 [Streptococcus agalactiae LMG 14747]